MNKKWIYGIVGVVLAAAIIGFAAMVFRANEMNGLQQVRIQAVEQTVMNRAKDVERSYDTKGRVDKLEAGHIVTAQRNEAMAASIFMMADRVSELEKKSIRTTEVLNNLARAVDELTKHTKELTKVITDVAVLNERRKHLEEK